MGKFTVGPSDNMLVSSVEEISAPPSPIFEPQKEELIPVKEIIKIIESAPVDLEPIQFKYK